VIYCHNISEWIVYLSSKEDTSVDASTSLNFFITEFMMYNFFYRDSKAALKLSTIVASEQCITTTKVFNPTGFFTDGHDVTDLLFKVLSHFKVSFWDCQLVGCYYSLLFK
jgi:hypothetical protein